MKSTVRQLGRENHKHELKPQENVLKLHEDELKLLSIPVEFEKGILEKQPFFEELNTHLAQESGKLKVNPEKVEQLQVQMLPHALEMSQLISNKVGQ